MSEESVTVMLMPDDDTEAILEKVRRADAKKINLIVPPGNRALQTLGGFTMLRKACDITGIEVTVYSDDEKARDMAQVCRFEVVSLDQEVRPREAPPPVEAPPHIVVETRPPEPAAVAVGEVGEDRPPDLEERLSGLSEADLALFDALEDISLTEDVELRPEAFARPRPVMADDFVDRPAPPRRRERPERRMPLFLRRILEPLAGALAALYIAVVGLFLKVAARFQPRGEREVEEAPLAAVGPSVQTEEERRLLRMQKLRYYAWTLVAVVGFTLLIVVIYLLSLPTVTVALTPRADEVREMDLAVTLVLTESVEAGPTVEGGIVSIPAKPIQKEMEGEVSTVVTEETWLAEGTATGAVVFVNLTSYGVSVPAGTNVSGGGASFHTTQDLWVPASDFRGIDAYLGKAQVNIVADQPGSAGNVGAGVVAVIDDANLAGILTVENSEQTAGGSERQTTVVTAEDHERLRQQLVTELQNKAYAELQKEVGGMQILTGTLKIETIEESFSAPVGSEATTLALTAKVRASALVSAPGAFQQAVEEAAKEQVGAVQAGQEIGKVTPGAIQQGEPVVGTADAWTYRTHVLVEIRREINDQLKREIGSALRGKTYQEAYGVMAGYSDRIAGFSISPVLNRLPSVGRIWVVDVQEAAGR